MGNFKSAECVARGRFEITSAITPELYDTKSIKTIVFTNQTRSLVKLKKTASNAASKGADCERGDTGETRSNRQRQLAEIFRPILTASKLLGAIFR